MKSRLPLLSIALASLFLATATLNAQQSLRTYAGTTAVSLSSTFTAALQSLNVSLETVPPAISRSRLGFVEFPIVGGIIDAQTAHGQILHTGGLELEAGSTVVKLTDYIIDTSDPAKAVLTGIVTVNGAYVGRIPLFDVALPSLSLPLQPIAGFVLLIPNVSLSLNTTAAAALNQVFRVSAFAGGIPVGTATVTAFVSKL